MSDLIDRQEAIEAVCSVVVGMSDYPLTYAYEIAEEALEKLPSAQPVTHEERTKTHACDLISRQVAIDVEGLDEQIRCEMCRNPMHTNRGCDGNCKYDEKLYERIMQILGERIKPLPSAEKAQLSGEDATFDCISRQDAVSRRRLLSDLKELVAAWKKYPVMAEQIKGVEAAIGYVEAIPSAQPQTSMLTVECKLDDEELAKAIEEVKKANLELIAAEPHWIPCSEQLPPEENKTYWVCTDNGHQHECRWTNANPIWTHLTTDWHWNIFDIPQYTKVVAWMELPKPYDGGEQDG